MKVFFQERFVKLIEQIIFLKMKTLKWALIYSAIEKGTNYLATEKAEGTNLSW